MRVHRATLLVLAALACGEGAPEARADGGAIERAPSLTSLAAGQTAGVLSDSLHESRASAIVRAAARVAPGVVSVNVVRREQRRASTAWDLFFVPRPYERLVQGMGSGFVISADGLVITNQHVTAAAEEIVVTTRDGVDYAAELLGEDPLTDIAVLKIQGNALPVAPLGRSDDLMIGEWVVAIGNPYGYLLGNSEPSVTAGVVSAVGRNILSSGDDGGIYVRMIQTDAAINPGNSGGPLANALGEVVGVNASILSQSGGSVGIGFAIPIERALRVADELRRFGSVRRAWVGLDVAGPDQLRDWKRRGGLPVTAVAEGGPADRAGIRPDDILIEAGGWPLRTFLDWEAVKLDVGPGDALPVDVQRADRRRTVRLVVEDLPSRLAERLTVLGDMQLITVSPAIRQERGIGREQGALVVQIGDATQRATGLRPGDVIFQVNRTPTATADDAREAFRAAAGRGAVRVYLERGGSPGFTDFRIR